MHRPGPNLAQCRVLRRRGTGRPCISGRARAAHGCQASSMRAANSRRGLGWPTGRPARSASSNRPAERTVRANDLILIIRRHNVSNPTRRSDSLPRKGTRHADCRRRRGQRPGPGEKRIGPELFGRRYQSTLDTRWRAPAGTHHADPMLSLAAMQAGRRGARGDAERAAETTMPTINRRAAAVLHW